MKMQSAKRPLLTLCAAAILAVSASSRAQNNANPPPAQPPPVTPVPPAAATPPPAAPPAEATPAAAAPKPAVKKHTTPATLPFHGTVTALDTNAMTLTVEKRTFDMTSNTMIIKDGKPVVLADGMVGEPVRGDYKKNADGKLDAVTVRFGGETEGKKKKPANN